jgi:hypothetical protein
MDRKTMRRSVRGSELLFSRNKQIRHILLLQQERGECQLSLEEQNLAEYVFRRKLKERKAEIDAELEPLRIKEWQAYEQCNNEFRKQERYCQEQREVLRALEELKKQERSMYDLDNRKDQIMSVCKIALLL